jgi:hypothetical protein
MTPDKCPRHFPFRALPARFKRILFSSLVLPVGIYLAVQKVPASAAVQARACETAAASPGLSVLAKRRTGRAGGLQETITRGDFERLLTTVFTTGERLAEFIEIDDVTKPASSPAHSDGDFPPAFRPGRQRRRPRRGTGGPPPSCRPRRRANRSTASHRHRSRPHRRRVGEDRGALAARRRGAAGPRGRHDAQGRQAAQAAARSARRRVSLVRESRTRHPAAARNRCWLSPRKQPMRRTSRRAAETRRALVLPHRGNPRPCRTRQRNPQARSRPLPAFQRRGLGRSRRAHAGRPQPPPPPAQRRLHRRGSGARRPALRPVGKLLQPHPRGGGFRRRHRGGCLRGDQRPAALHLSARIRQRPPGGTTTPTCGRATCSPTGSTTAR